MRSGQAGFVSGSGETEVPIGLARERAQTYKSSHGPNHSHCGHSVISGSFPDGRVRVGLSVARRPRHSSHHHIDPVLDGSFVGQSREQGGGERERERRFRQFLREKYTHARARPT